MGVVDVNIKCISQNGYVDLYLLNVLGQFAELRQ